MITKNPSRHDLMEAQCYAMAKGIFYASMSVAMAILAIENKESLILDIKYKQIGIGEYQSDLNGYADLEKIKITPSEIYVRLEQSSDFFAFSEIQTTDCSDHLTILKELEEYLDDIEIKWRNRKNKKS